MAHSTSPDALPREHKVFSRNYKKFTNLVRTSWIPDFVATGIITLHDENTIRSDPNAIPMMLERVSQPLQAGLITPFYNMLKIMRDKEEAAKNLADEIFAELESPTAGN